MRLHRFLVDIDLKQSAHVIENAELARQLRLVLRLTPGHKIILIDGRGHEAEAMIKEMDKNSVKVVIEPSQKIDREAEKKLTLYCSILKKENFELVVQKAVELGTAVIVPILCDRTIKSKLNTDRLKKIIQEAVEQSGRTVLPQLREPITFTESLKVAGDNVGRIIFDASGTTLKKLPLPQPSIEVWIGPEGGWTAAELHLAEENGLAITSFGKRVLRAETAAIAACAIILS